MAYLDFINNAFTRVQAVIVSLGAASAGQLVGLDAAGKLDVSVLPTGIGADTQAATASEALTAGDLVNIDPANGQVRKADNSNGRPADGFVIAAVANGATATVYFDGTNASVTAPLGPVYLGTAGGVTATAPLTPGTTIQRVGTIGPGGLAFQFLIPFVNQ